MSCEFNLNTQEISHLINSAIQAGKHKEFYHLSNELGLREEITTHSICKVIARSKPELFENILSRITGLLD